MDEIPEMSERQLIHVREVLDLMRILTGDDCFTEHGDELLSTRESDNGKDLIVCYYEIRS